MVRRKTYTRDQLEAMNAKDLKSMAFHSLGLSGLSKKPKDVVVDAVIAYQDGGKASIAPGKAASSGPITGLNFTGQSSLTNPGASFGNKTTTTIQVSCGASSGAFPVQGKTVREVGEFLREVLNVSQLSTGLVNGKEVDSGYILKSGDRLEFLKPAGRKG